jgi:hypothetical protein
MSIAIEKAEAEAWLSGLSVMRQSSQTDVLRLGP